MTAGRVKRSEAHPTWQIQPTSPWVSSLDPRYIRYWLPQNIAQGAFKKGGGASNA